MQSMKLGARPGVKEPRMLMCHTNLRWRMWLANLGIGLLCARRIEVENDVSERVNCPGFDPTPLLATCIYTYPHTLGGISSSEIT
jgi:hypothetical protein